MRLHAKAIAASSLAALLASCTSLGLGDGGWTAEAEPAVASDPYGPAGDYPVVLGPSYTVGSVTYTPDDALNYDAVGYAIADDPGTLGVSAAHHTLPLPSYVEVTELNEGRTILVRVERRGPMESNDLLALSPAAMAQLGISGTTPVRVRRVNPPETERTLLRSDDTASMRMETPSGLLTVLRRKLPPAPSAAAIRPEEVPEPVGLPTPSPDPVPSPSATPTPEASPIPEPATEPMTVTPASSGYFVQAGAYSERESADRVAAAIDGKVYPAGRLWRVRSGPFASAAEAERDLARVRAAGYRDARVVFED